MSFVERAREGVRFSRGEHVASLLAACRKALAGQEARAAWLLSDRLCRITGASEATPFLLRSAASALLGDAQAARRDIETADAINPEHPHVVEAMLRSPDEARRVFAAQRILTIDPVRADALLALAATGHQAVVSLTLREGVIKGQAFWNGENQLELRWRSDRGEGQLALQGSVSTGNGFAWYAEMHLAWPADAQALALHVGCERALVQPTVLRALPALPPENWRGASPEAPNQLMVIVPVHGNLVATEACFACLFAEQPSYVAMRVVAIDDATPEPAIAQLLDRLVAEAAITLLRNTINLGFAASVNRALELRRAGEDVLLLNADAYVPPGAIKTLREAVYASPENGTAVPFSNNGEDVSIPTRFRFNPLPQPDRVARLNAVARRANGAEAVVIPNGVGFCLYIKGVVLDAIGGFSCAYERGYFEDVDFCLRARHAGFRNICATGAYVGHSGSLSFAGDKRALVRRNLARIHENFPEYREISDAFVAQDPLRAAAMRIDEAVLPEGMPSRLIVAPDAVPDRHLRFMAQCLPELERRTMLLRITQRVPVEGHESLGQESLGPGNLGQGNLGLQLSSLDGDFPARLVWEKGVNAPESALPGWFDALALEDVVLVDPAAIPAEIGRHLVARSVRQSIALLDCAALQAAPPAWCRDLPMRMVTTCGMEATLRHLLPEWKTHLLQPTLSDQASSRDMPAQVAAPDRIAPILGVITGRTEDIVLYPIKALASILHDMGHALA